MTWPYLLPSIKTIFLHEYIHIYVLFIWNHMYTYGLYWEAMWQFLTMRYPRKSPSFVKVPLNNRVVATPSNPDWIAMLMLSRLEASRSSWSPPPWSPSRWAEHNEKGQLAGWERVGRVGRVVRQWGGGRGGGGGWGWGGVWGRGETVLESHYGEEVDRLLLSSLQFFFFLLRPSVNKLWCTRGKGSHRGICHTYI